MAQPSAEPKVPKDAGFSILQNEPDPPEIVPSPTDESKRDRKAKSKRKWNIRRRTSKKVLVFCDLDGCLADFDAGVFALINKLPKDVRGDPEASTKMWEAIQEDPMFYESLPWTKDGKQLWEYLVQFTEQNSTTFEKPVILTGLPRFVDRASKAKKAWCSKNLGRGTAVKCCMTFQKVRFIQPGRKCVLIDDRIETCASWEARGGVAITHKSTTETLKQWETMFGALQYGDTGSVGPSPRANEDSEVKLDQDAAATEPAPTNVASP